MSGGVIRTKPIASGAFIYGLSAPRGMRINKHIQLVERIEKMGSKRVCTACRRRPCARICIPRLVPVFRNSSLDFALRSNFACKRRRRDYTVYIARQKQ